MIGIEIQLKILTWGGSSRIIYIRNSISNMSTVIFLKKIKLVKKLYFDFFKYLTVSLKGS